MHVEEHVHFAQIQEIKRGGTGANVLFCLAEDLSVRRMMISVDAEGKPLALELVEDGRCSGNSSEVVDVAPFDPVEIRNQPWRNAAVKQRPQAEHPFASFLQQLSCVSVVVFSIGQKKETAEPPKRRALRVIVEKIPVAIFCRWNARQHRWNRTRAESQYCAQRLAMRKHVREKIAVFDILPAKRINQNDHGHLFPVAGFALR